MDIILADLAGWGVPALVLKSVMDASGLRGAAKLTAALSSIGPGGMNGGLVTLPLLGTLCQYTAGLTFVTVCEARAKLLCCIGENEEDVISRIDTWPISTAMKSQLKEHIRCIATYYQNNEH